MSVKTVYKRHYRSLREYQRETRLSNRDMSATDIIVRVLNHSIDVAKFAKPYPQDYRAIIAARAAWLRKAVENL